MTTKQSPGKGRARLLGRLAGLADGRQGEQEIAGLAVEWIARSLEARAAVLVVGSPDPGRTGYEIKWGPPEAGASIAIMARAALAGRSGPESDAPGSSSGRIVEILFRGEAPLGALGIEADRPWTNDERELVRSTGSLLATAIHSSRMIGELRRDQERLSQRNSELEALARLGGRLRDIENEREEEIFSVTLEILLRSLALDAGWILLGEPGGGSLSLVAGRGLPSDFVEESKRSGIGNCLCQDVIRGGTALVARNTTDCPRLTRLFPDGATLTHACIPLRFEGGVLGVMNIAGGPDRPFSDRQLEFLQTAANQLCVAIDRSRSVRSERRHAQEANALASLSRAIGGSLDPSRVLAAVGEYARGLLGAERCVILEGKKGEPLLVASISGPPPGELRTGDPLDLSALDSRAILETQETGRPLVIEDAENDARCNHALARRWGVGSALLIPLLVRGNLDGVVIVTRPQASHWSAEQVELAGALARHAAMDLDGARLHKEVQEALQRLKQAQYGMLRSERLAALGTLSSSLAHEVRNPLNSINLQLVLLSRRTAGLAVPLREEIAGMVDSARREIERLDTLVDEFLSLSSIDRVSLVEADPDAVIGEVLGLVEPEAESHGVQIVLELSGGLPPIPLDTEKMKQVLINLLRNAIEAMPSGGVIRVTTSLDGGEIEISVADTGCGIDPSLDIFDFFVTTKEGGSGLGLPIAKRIVEAHDGRLSYSSEPGAGTTFTVTLRVSES